MSLIDFKYKIWNDSLDSVPTVIIHSFIGDGEDVWKSAHHINCPKFNLVAIYEFDGDGDLSPWKAEGIRKGQLPFKGNAEMHLKNIIEEIIPKIEAALPSPSSYYAMAGYSLAGLFTLWSCWYTNCFKRIACISSSFWYPKLMEFLANRPMLQLPECIYLSLGNKESKTNHPLLKQVEVNTEKIFKYMQSHKIGCTFEMNQGNHFFESTQRTAKGIKWILLQPE